MRLKRIHEFIKSEIDTKLSLFAKMFIGILIFVVMMRNLHCAYARLEICSLRESGTTVRVVQATEVLELHGSIAIVKYSKCIVLIIEFFFNTHFSLIRFIIVMKKKLL